MLVQAQTQFADIWYFPNGGYLSEYGYADSLAGMITDNITGSTADVAVYGLYQWHGAPATYHGPQTYGVAYYKLVTPTVSNSTGTATFDGVALETDYIITHGLGYTPTFVIIQATSADACDNSWISDITSSTFTITFQMNPTTGTDNLSFSWLAVR